MRWIGVACGLRSKAEAIPLPQPDGEPKEYSDKIKKLVEEISSLTLSETAQLGELLKVCNAEFMLCVRVSAILVCYIIISSRDYNSVVSLIHGSTMAMYFLLVAPHSSHRIR